MVPVAAGMPVLKASLRRNWKIRSFNVGRHGKLGGFAALAAGASMSSSSPFIDNSGWAPEALCKAHRSGPPSDQTWYRAVVDNEQNRRSMKLGRRMPLAMETLDAQA